MVLAGSDSGGWDTIQVLDANTFTWKSSDESVATVDDEGLVTFNQVGECTIGVFAGEIERTEIDVNVSIKHNHNIVKVAKVAPTCQKTGMKAHYECTECGKLFTDKYGKKPTTEAKLTLKKVSHKYKKKIVTDEYLKTPATCTKKASYFYACTMCEQAGTKSYTSGKALGHDYQGEYVTKATPTKNGKTYSVCTRCDKQHKLSTIYKASNIKLNKSSIKYIGDGLEKDAITVTVKNSKKKVIADTEYTVSYSEPEYTSKKNGVGYGTVTVTFNDDCEYYEGSKTLKYKITGCPK